MGDEVKSISGEERFLHDTEDRGVLRACLWEQAAEIAAKLTRRRLPSRHFTRTQGVQPMYLNDCGGRLTPNALSSFKGVSYRRGFLTRIAYAISLPSK